MSTKFPLFSFLNKKIIAIIICIFFSLSLISGCFKSVYAMDNGGGDLGSTGTNFSLFNGNTVGISDSNAHDEKPIIVNGIQYVVVGDGYSGSSNSGTNCPILIYEAGGNYFSLEPQIVGNTDNNAQENYTNFGDFYVYYFDLPSLSNDIVICGSMAGGSSTAQAFIICFDTSDSSFYFNFIPSNIALYITQINYLKTNEMSQLGYNGIFTITCVDGSYWDWIVKCQPTFTGLMNSILWTPDIYLSQIVKPLSEYSFDFFDNVGYALTWDGSVNQLFVLNMDTSTVAYVYNFTDDANTNSAFIVRCYISSDVNYLYFTTTPIVNGVDCVDYWSLTNQGIFTLMLQEPIIDSNNANSIEHHFNIMPLFSSSGIMILYNEEDNNLNSVLYVFDAQNDTILQTLGSGTLNTHFSDNDPVFWNNEVVLGSEGVQEVSGKGIYVLIPNSFYTQPTLINYVYSISPNANNITLNAFTIATNTYDIIALNQGTLYQWFSDFTNLALGYTDAGNVYVYTSGYVSEPQNIPSFYWGLVPLNNVINDTVDNSGEFSFYIQPYYETSINDVNTSNTIYQLLQINFIDNNGSSYNHYFLLSFSPLSGSNSSPPQNSLTIPVQLVELENFFENVYTDFVFVVFGVVCGLLTWKFAFTGLIAGIGLSIFVCGVVRLIPDWAIGLGALLDITLLVLGSGLLSKVIHKDKDVPT